LTLSDTRPEAITGRVQQSRDWIRASSMPGLQLHYTEWSSSYTPTDFLHDQYLSAAFIVEKLRETAPLADSMSYWTFTDIFEEMGPRFTAFHGGFGLMNYQGIRKPGYFAYKFLAQLGTEDLVCEDRQSWVTRKRDGSVQALLWDFQPMATPAGQNNQHYFRGERPASAASELNLRVRNLLAGQYELQVYRVGYRHNDAFTEYIRMGSPAQLTRHQVATLQAAASGKPEETRTINVKPDGRLELKLPMSANDVVLVELKPLRTGPAR
jgi:xylan 1,4-beta-xylosidase